MPRHRGQGRAALLASLRRPAGSLDWPLMLLAALPGMALAIWIYGSALDPRHVEWLLAEGDSLQHFSGWDMFRRDAWRWPLGALPTLGSEVGASIVYSDSIPLLAIPLKLLHGMLPDPFQYIAPVMLINLALNGAVAAGLLRWQGASRGLALGGALLVVSLPMVTMRGPGALGHEALSSHWLILLAFWFFLMSTTGWRHGMRWATLLMVAVAVHFYLFFMVGVLWSAWWALALWRERASSRVLSRLVLLAIFTVVAVLTTMHGVGYFQFALTVDGDTGFGLYSTELFSFINPGSAALFFEGGHFQGASRLWSGWRSPVPGQYEGFAYAGAGVLWIWGAALLVVMRTHTVGLHAQERWLALPVLLLFVFALSDRLVVGSWVVSLPYSGWLEPLTHHLRSAGRMAWPLLYALLLAALLLLSRRLSGPWMAGLLGISVMLQAWDVAPWQRYVRQQIQQLAPGELVERPFAWRQDDEVVAMLAQAREIRLLPGDDWHQVKVVSWLAARHELVSNVAYYARTNPGILYAAARSQREALESGVVEPGVVYALTAPGLIDVACETAGVVCYAVEGMTLASKADQGRGGER